MFKKQTTPDLYVTLIYSRDDFSSIIKEIVEYAVDIVREKYCLETVYREIIDDKHEFPVLVINELEPIVLNEIPSLENIAKLLLAGLKTNSDKVSDRDYASDRALTTHL